MRKTALCLLLVLTLAAGLLPSAVAAEAAAEAAPVTLSTVRALNGGTADITYDTQLNVATVNGRFIEGKILNADDACAALEELRPLLRLEGVPMELYSVSVSPQTGNRYYSFYQTDPIVLPDGTEISVDNMEANVKLVTDAEGNPVALSNCAANALAPWETQPEGLTVTLDEALTWTLNHIDDDEHVTEGAYVNLIDEGQIRTAARVSKRIPTWAIVTDRCIWPGCAGTVYFISMVRSDSDDPDDRITVCKKLPIREATLDCLTETLGSYTSLVFFDGMEDFGTLTMTVNDADWVIDAREGAELKEREVTVPLVYIPAQGLYAMGSLEHHILVADYYSFAVLENPVPNLLVSDNPADPASWHWYYGTVDDENGESVPLFLNMGYAASNFETMLRVHENYQNILGADSYDALGMPQLLLLYMTDDDKYPGDVSGFAYNAANLGSINDWAVMTTSPAMCSGEDETVIGHEYCHGINQHNSQVVYNGIIGEVEEAFADILGLAVYNASHGTQETRIGAGAPGRIIRDIANPEDFRQSRFLYGPDYLRCVEPAMPGVGRLTDHGGVHNNCSVLGFLAYAVSEANAGVFGKPLSWTDVARVWYEASFLRVSSFGYDALGAYLRFAASAVGLEQDKQDTLALYLDTLGFNVNDSQLFIINNLTGSREVWLYIDDDAPKFESGIADTDKRIINHIMLINNGKIMGMYEEGLSWFNVARDLDMDNVEGKLFTWTPEEGTTSVDFCVPYGFELNGETHISVCNYAAKTGETWNVGDVRFLTDILRDGTISLPENEKIRFNMPDTVVLTEVHDAHSITLHRFDVTAAEGYDPDRSWQSCTSVGQYLVSHDSVKENLYIGNRTDRVIDGIWVTPPENADNGDWGGNLLELSGVDPLQPGQEYRVPITLYTDTLSWRVRFHIAGMEEDAFLSMDPAYLGDCPTCWIDYSLQEDYEGFWFNINKLPVT